MMLRFTLLISSLCALIFTSMLEQNQAILKAVPSFKVVTILIAPTSTLRKKISYMNFGTLQILINLFDEKCIVNSNSNEKVFLL